MLPSAIQIQSSSVSGGSFKPSAFTFSTQKLVSKLLFKNSISARPGASFFQSSTLPELKSNLRARKINHFESSVVAVEPETGAEDSISSTQPKNESPTRSELKLNGRARKINHYDSSVAAVPVEPEAAAEDSTSSCQAENEKPGKAVQLMQKPRLVLKFVWMEKNLGLTLDYLIPGHGTVPLSRYYFWPRKDAWEELKELIESKPWISQKQMVIILNHATDIINLWQLRCGDRA